MSALPKAGHEHHSALLPHVDVLAVLASELVQPCSDELRDRVAAEYRFMVGQLVPHMEQAEETLYPELERLLQDSHAMASLRREHVEVRRLIIELGGLVKQDLWLGTRLRLRRVLYRLYAILETHLGEEQEYLTVLGGNLSEQEQEELGRAMKHATAVGV